MIFILFLDNTRRCSSAQSGHAHIEVLKVVGDHEHQELTLPRGRLGRPGSSPPNCTSKCGKCMPCTPVLVSVPPETPIRGDYYPLVWRCKCKPPRCCCCLRMLLYVTFPDRKRQAPQVLPLLTYALICYIP
ncbi:EPIDERMAL PATTERNING FACTOR-like protein 6, partial [Cucurbita argyrosperma subsp. sororia]